MSIVSFLLAGSAIAKLAHITDVVRQLNAFGFDDHKIVLIAAGEIASAILLAIPRTRSLGLLFVSAFLGGAIATEFQHAGPVAPPAILLAIVWVASILNNSALLQEK